MSRGARTLAAALLLAAPLLAACSAGDDEPDQPNQPNAAVRRPAATPESVATPAPRPARNVCHEMTYDQAVAPTDEAEVAPCEKIHTAETFAVGELHTITDGHLLAVDADQVQHQVATTCPQRLAGFAGGSEEDLRLSMLRTVWFTPTVEQSDAGANWFRCDVIVVGREGALAPVKGRLSDALATDEGRDRYGMCGTAQPGAPDFEQVICRAPHSWRAIRVVDLEPEATGGKATGGKATGGRAAAAYPGEASVRAAGQDVCDDAARDVATDALDYQWGYEWPTAEQWDGGQTYGRCWALDQG